MNLVQGVFTIEADGPRLTIGDQRLPVDGKLLSARPGLRSYLDRSVAVGIRPEDMEDASLGGGTDAAGGAGIAVLHAVADLTEALGSDLLVHFGLPAPAVVTEDTRELARDAGADLPRVAVADRTMVVARCSPRSRARAGDRIGVTVDTSRLHVFDLDTGLAIR
jgi:multiple sugar transport system ATP-binding protein